MTLRKVLARVSSASRPIVLLGCCGLLGGCEPTPDRRDHVVSGPEQVSPTERAVAETIGTMHWLHLREMERGEVAVQRASRTDVRVFADRLIRDHAYLDRRLRQLAERMQVEPRPPRRWATRRADPFDEDRELEGIDFDRAYLQKVIDTHDRMIGALIDARALSDELLEQTTRSMLPVLAQHRDLAFRLLARLPIA